MFFLEEDEILVEFLISSRSLCDWEGVVNKKYGTGISEGISSSPLFHFLALVSFLTQLKARISFLGLSLLRNSTETLATPATYRLFCIFKVTEKIASQTTMGFVIDDPTRLQDVGEAAKKFFNEGSNINCCGDWTPKYCPLFSINNHVLDWLSKPERERYHLIEVRFSFSYQYWK